MKLIKKGGENYSRGTRDYPTFTPTCKKKNMAPASAQQISSSPPTPSHLRFCEQPNDERRMTNDESSEEAPQDTEQE